MFAGDTILGAETGAADNNTARKGLGHIGVGTDLLFQDICC